MKKILVILSLASIVLVGAGCQKVTPHTQTAPYLTGVSFSPKSYNPLTFIGFYKEAATIGSTLTWAGSMSEFTTEKKTPFVIEELGSRYNYTPIIITGTFGVGSGSTVQENVPSDKFEEYKNDIVHFAEKDRPPYLALGNETNFLYEQKPESYKKFVALFNETYDAVKKVSPDTKFFITFQLEHMKGLRGGLFGGKNDTSKTDWKVLDDFSKADFFAFTTYPGIIYDNPEDIPSDYYSEIKKHTSKEIAFSEVGWPSNLTVAGHTSTPDEQKAFVERFASDMKEVKPIFITWPFLYDQNIGEPFKSMGLKDSDGNKKPAYDTWAAL
jgi:hypothetical protein